ncbi:MAG: hypothetical protein ACTH31_15925 [Pseudoclavibacter sp.]
MAYRYTNVASGQVVESEQPLGHLDGLARWRREEFTRPTRRRRKEAGDGEDQVAEPDE